MTRPTSSPPAPRVLLVERQDDKHAVRRLVERHQSTPCFSIVDKGGVPQLLPSIGPEIKVSGRQVVGMLVDANDDVTARWNAVRGRLLKAGILSPTSPDSAGTIMEGTPRVGVWLTSDNQSPGELEDFVVRMIPNGDQVWPLSKRSIEGIPAAERKFAQHKMEGTALCLVGG